MNFHKIFRGGGGGAQRLKGKNFLNKNSSPRIRSPFLNDQASTAQIHFLRERSHEIEDLDPEAQKGSSSLYSFSVVEGRRDL